MLGEPTCQAAWRAATIDKGMARGGVVQGGGSTAGQFNSMQESHILIVVDFHALLQVATDRGPLAAGTLGCNNGGPVGCGGERGR